MNPEHLEEQSSSASFANNSRTNEVTIVKKAATLGDKSFSPNPVITYFGGTITWTNTDNISYILLHLANLTLSTQANYLIQA